MKVTPDYLRQIADKQYEDPKLVKIAKSVLKGKISEFRFDEKGMRRHINRLCVPNDT